MKHVTPINQLRAELKSKSEEKLLAAYVANLHPESAEQFCLMCVAYLRMGVRPVSNNAFLYACVCNFLNVIEADRDTKTIQMAWAVNPAVIAVTQIDDPQSYRNLMFMDTAISKSQANDLMSLITSKR